MAGTTERKHMSGGTVKVRLRSGGREIEIEGPRTDVDDLLEKWWVPSEQPAEEDDGDENGTRDPPTPNKAKRRRSRSRSSERRHSEGDDSSVDSQNIANSIKEDSRFPTFEKKILHLRDRYNKVALVVWHAGIPLTSGDIHKTLKALLVRINLAHVSNTLTSNKFLPDRARARGGPPTRYVLTGAAKAAFESWLTADEE